MRIHDELYALMFETMAKYRAHMDTKPGLWKLKIEDIKELGLCHNGAKVITLNKWMVENSPESQIIDTLMHEVAHAIAGIEFSKTGRVMAHGKKWKAWARRLGATPKATVPLSELGECAVEKFSKEKRPNKYHIVYIDNVTNPSKVEVVHSCKRRLVRLSSRGMRGRDETYGKLYHIRVEDYEKFQDMPEVLTTKIFI